MVVTHKVYRSALIICLWLVFSAAATADPERGKMLYENHCIGCHVSSVHDRSNNRATSLDRVRFEVVRWSREQNLSWSGDDVTDVVEYLNETFYEFD